MPKKLYTHVFFDLDHTLWDFDANNLLTFDEMLSKHKLYSPVIPDLETFMTAYKKHNKALWDLYKEGKIEKSFLSYHRFELTLLDFGIENIETAKAMAADYISISPTKTILRNGSHEILSYLQSRYALGLITNGFNEIQFVKLEKAGLKKYFPLVVTSEEAGCKKPEPDIFHYALKKAGARPETSIYVGDEPETDVVGAKAAGVDQILVTFGKDFTAIDATHVVDTLPEIAQIL